MIKINTQIVMKNIVLFSFLAIFIACGKTNKEPASLTKLKAQKSDLIIKPSRRFMFDFHR